ncbi:RNA-directed DNA polymerase, eukaryota, reverse transcriptase zinc-binding domain protein [Tanacetum coccineum]
MTSGVWCDIIKASFKIDSIVPGYQDSFSIKVLDGSNVSFWKDVDRWHLVNDSWTGNWNWRFQPCDRALGDLDSLISMVCSLSLSSEGYDKWHWIFEVSGRPALNRLPTRVNLESRGVPIPSSLCPFCGDVDELIDHCLLSCSFATKVWRKVWDW